MPEQVTLAYITRALEQGYRYAVVIERNGAQAAALSIHKDYAAAAKAMRGTKATAVWDLEDVRKDMARRR
jgi:hypothetical protein